MLVDGVLQPYPQRSVLDAFQDKEVDGAVPGRVEVAGDDRVQTALRFDPAYLVSRIAGVPMAKIDRSVLGLPLRLLAIVADATAVDLAGRAFGVW